MNRVILFFLLITAGIFVSCNEDEPLEGDFGVTQPIGPSSFEVLIDTTTTFTGTQNAARTLNRRTTIIGLNENGASVNIAIDGAGLGTYNLDGTENRTAIYFQADSLESYNYINLDTLGQVMITRYDSRAGLISGTFNFAAVKTVVNDEGIEQRDTLLFTEGQFTNIILNTDGTEPSNPENNSGDFEVMLNGEQYASTQNSANRNDFGLNINALNPQDQRFSIQIEGNVQSGDTYNLNASNDDVNFLYFPSGGQSFQATSGSLTIDDIDLENRVISGSFSGNLTPLNGDGADITMTEGMFELPYGNGNNNSLASATIDGEEYTATTFFTIPNSDQYRVRFKNDNDQSFTFYLPRNLDNGIYDLTSPQQDYSAVYSTGATTYNSVAGSGQIVILSSINGTVDANFNFEASSGSGESVSITEGSFAIQLP